MFTPLLRSKLYRCPCSGAGLWLRVRRNRQCLNGQGNSRTLVVGLRVVALQATVPTAQAQTETNN